LSNTCCLVYTLLMEKKKLTPVTDWIKESLSIYFKKDNFFYLAKFALLQLLLNGIFYAGSFLFVGKEFYTNPNALASDMPSFFLYFIPSTILMIIFGTWVYATTIHAVSQVVEGKFLGVKETFKLSAKRVLPFAATAVLVGIVTILGFVLLIIPGVIFIIWFYFSQYIAVVEKSGPIASMKRSKELVKGYFRPLLGRAVVLLVYSFAIQSVLAFVLNFFGSILVTLLYPYFYLLSYLLYNELKKIKKQKQLAKPAI